MKRLPRTTFDSIATPLNVYRAYRRTRRGKRKSAAALAFEVHADRHVFRLARALSSEHWRPRPYRLRIIRDPKVRAIVIADFEDRVVHQAVHHVVAPHYDRSLIDHTFACRDGKGTHRAALAYLQATRRFQYRLHLDIRRYFPSIDHRILLGILLGPVEDTRIERLFVRLVRSGRGLYRQPRLLRALPDFAKTPVPMDTGLPIGTLFSQWCANLYLSGADHFILRTLKPGRYFRYLDDLVLFDNDAARLRDFDSILGEWLWDHRRLRLHDDRSGVRRAAEPSTYLGFEVDRRGLKMGRKARRRMAKKLISATRRGPVAVEQTMRAYAALSMFG